jgi:hypothetical protein
MRELERGFHCEFWLAAALDWGERYPSPSTCASAPRRLVAAGSDPPLVLSGRHRSFVVFALSGSSRRVIVSRIFCERPTPVDV